MRRYKEADNADVVTTDWIDGIVKEQAKPLINFKCILLPYYLRLTFIIMQIDLITKLYAIECITLKAIYFSTSI